MKVILLGDSITQGLGSKKINFVGELEKLLSSNDSVVNLAMTGTVINYVSTIFSEIEKEKADYAVILYGNVDAMLKPSRTGKIFKHLPKRFNGPDGSMLLPRPFYSHNWYKSLAQHIENCIRTVLRNLILSVDGTEQWMPLEQYQNHYDDVCRKLIKLGITPIICSTVYIDDNLFPGSDSEYKEYNAWMKKYAGEHHICYIDFYEIFRQLIEKEGWKRYFNYDHFHPNGEGYLVMASNIAEALQN